MTKYSSFNTRKPERCQHVTGGYRKTRDPDILYPTISLDIHILSMLSNERGTDLETQLLEVKHTSRPTFLFAWAYQTPFQNWHFRTRVASTWETTSSKSKTSKKFTDPWQNILRFNTRKPERCQHVTGGSRKTRDPDWLIIPKDLPRRSHSLARSLEGSTPKTSSLLDKMLAPSSTHDAVCSHPDYIQY